MPREALPTPVWHGRRTPHHHPPVHVGWDLPWRDCFTTGTTVEAERSIYLVPFHGQSSEGLPAENVPTRYMICPCALLDYTAYIWSRVEITASRYAYIRTHNTAAASNSSSSDNNTCHAQEKLQRSRQSPSPTRKHPPTHPLAFLFLETAAAEFSS